ncbi:MAG: hypothetical protein ACYCZX_04895 [Rhodospirillaceae bacterium]
MKHADTIAGLKAQALKWKCRTYSFAAIPFVGIIGLHVGTHGAFVPVWVLAVSAMAMGAFGALSTSASLDHLALTGKMVWF